MNEPNQRAARRELNEPQEQSHPLPPAMKSLMLVMAIWGTGYFLTVGTWSINAGDQRTPLTIASHDVVDGSVVFATHCASCHQAEGQGLSGVFPPLARSRWVTDSVDAPIQILLHGVQGDIDVQGVIYNGMMPAFAQLSDVEMAAVLSHVRSAWGNQAEPIDAEQVGEQRQRFAARDRPWAGGAELADALKR